MWNDQWTVLFMSPSIICHSLLHPVSSSSKSKILLLLLPLDRLWPLTSTSPALQPQRGRAGVCQSGVRLHQVLLLLAHRRLHLTGDGHCCSAPVRLFTRSLLRPPHLAEPNVRVILFLGGCAGSRPSCSSPAPAGSCGGWFASEGSRWALVRIFVSLLSKTHLDLSVWTYWPMKWKPALRVPDNCTWFWVYFHFWVLFFFHTCNINNNKKKQHYQKQRLPSR